MALIQNNAKVAAQISMALSDIERRIIKEKIKTTTSAAAPVVIGGSIMDVHYSVLDDNLKVSH